MRRIMILGTALAVLAVATGVAYAATFNSYSASFKFSTTKAGSKKHPVPISYTQTYKAKGMNGNRAAPLIDIKTTVYGLIPTTKGHPTCSPAKIMANPLKFNKACPKRSLVATGGVKALLGPGNDLKAKGSPCNPALNVYYGGPGKAVFFFSTAPGHTCGSLKTGATKPWVGHLSVRGKNEILDVPLPPDVSTSAGGLKGVYGSLVVQQLNWKSSSQASVACKHGKRPWKVTFTSVNHGQRETPQTVKGSGKC